MEDKPYSVDSSDDINIEEEHVEDNHSEYFFVMFVVFEIFKTSVFNISLIKL